MFDPPLPMDYSNAPISKILEKLKISMPDKLQEGYNRIEKLEEIGPVNAEVIPGAENIPFILKKYHISSAILTNNTRISIEKYIDKFRFLKEFLILTRNEAKMKPDPDGIQKIIDIFKNQDSNFSKENILYIGDSFIDAGVCYNSGLEFIWFKSRPNIDTTSFLVAPTRIITHWDQLEPLIQEMTSF